MIEHQLGKSDDLRLRGHHYHDYWVKHDWAQDFSDFPIRVEYTIKLRRLGMEMQ